MSTKSSLFLTNDNEHCYQELNEPFYEGDRYIGSSIYLEIDKGNGEIVLDNEFDTVIKIHPNSELYKMFMRMQDGIKCPKCKTYLNQ